MRANYLKKILLALLVIFINATMVLAAPSADASAKSKLTGGLAIVDKDTYLERSKSIKTDIDDINTKIKNLNQYNLEVSNKLDELNELYKFDKNAIASDTMRQIREIRKNIKVSEKKEKTITESDSIKNLVDNQEYDKALEKLNGILEEKKVQYKDAEEKNAIWKQIDSLIS